MQSPDPARREEKAVIWHGAEREPAWDGSDLRFVIPVRDPAIRQLSLRRNRMRDGEWPEDECRRNVFRKVTETDSPVKLVSYEALVQDPDAVAGDFIEWLGLPWRSFPTETMLSPTPADGPVYDGNAKYRDGTVYLP
jgi:hypothetical protein